jgi:hypothetical protein
MLNKKMYSLLIFILVLANVSEAQSRFFSILFPPIDSVITNYDTTKVDPKLDQLTLRAYTGYNGNELLFKSKEETAVYAANSKYKLGLGFGYRWLIVNATFISPFSKRYNTDRGESLSTDIQMNIYAPKFQTDIRAQWIDGYYQKTKNEIYFDFNNKGPFKIRTDLKLRALGAGLTYTFNENYLHKHGFDQTKVMKKSGGTLLTGFRLGYLKVFSDSALFRQAEDIRIDEFVSLSGGLSFGGAYTFLLNQHWFFSIHGAINATVKNVEYQGYYISDDFKDQATNLSVSPTVRTSFGYNSSKHFIGVYGILDNELNNKIGSHQIDYFFTSFKLIYAYRIVVTK